MQLGRRSVSALAFSAFAGPARAQGARAPIKIGLILPMTGPFAVHRPPDRGRRQGSTWRSNGDTVAGKKVEVILKDDAGVADTTRRLAQELVVNDKVACSPASA